MMAPSPATKSEISVIGLPRVLGLRDVVLLYAIAVVSLQWLSTAAQIGPSSLVLWLLALVIFFVPSGLVVMELSSRYDGEGGLYVWIKQALGDVHGFVAGWSYVVSILVFFPTLLLFISGTASYIAGGAWPGLKDSYGFNAFLSLTALWLAIGANILGLEHAKRLVNGCALVMGSVLAILVIAASISVSRFGSATAFAGNLLPDVTDPTIVKSFATMMFALVGLELAPLMGSEIRNPRRVIPRAIVVSGALVIAFYLLGTWALLVALPKEKIEAITGIPEGIAVIADRIGVPILGPLAALLMTIASAGVLTAWVTGSARLPYVVGIDHHLPRALGRLHPRWHSPYVALIVSGAITTLLVLLALAGTTIGNAYQILVDMAVPLAFIPSAYLFVALPILRAKRVGDRPGLLCVPGGRIGVVLVSALGLASTLVSIGFALAPPGTGQAGMFYLKVLGGCGLLLGLGLALYFARQRSSPNVLALRHKHLVDDNQTNRNILQLRPQDWRMRVTRAEGPERAMFGDVLLVEDNVVNPGVAKATLRKLGLSPRVANNGAQAVDLVRQHDFDVVLVDCQMPVMDGYEATAIIRQLPDGRGARLPIVALTANAMSGDEQKCLEVGMTAFLAKPYTLATLRAMLARWLPAGPVSAAGARQPADAHKPGAAAGPPAIDLKVIATLCEIDEPGGMDMARAIFGSFLETADMDIAKVEAAIADGDGNALGQAARALKSSTANVGAQVLSGCYRELETCGREGRVDRARELFELTRREHERAISQLREILWNVA